MKFKNSLLVVRDLSRSQEFYREILGLEVIQDFGANVILSGGISLQSEKSWLTFLQKGEEELYFGGCDCELYFESERFDEFIELLREKRVSLIHPPREHRWGQRAVRFFDPDRHVIEVGEPIGAVCRRFYQSGLSVEGVARRMDVPLEFVERYVRE